MLQKTPFLHSFWFSEYLLHPQKCPPDGFLCSSLWSQFSMNSSLSTRCPRHWMPHKGVAVCGDSYAWLNLRVRYLLSGHRDLSACRSCQEPWRRQKPEVAEIFPILKWNSSSYSHLKLQCRSMPRNKPQGWAGGHLLPGTSSAVLASPLLLDEASLSSNPLLSPRLVPCAAGMCSGTPALAASTFSAVLHLSPPPEEPFTCFAHRQILKWTPIRLILDL